MKVKYSTIYKVILVIVTVIISIVIASVLTSQENNVSPDEKKIREVALKYDLEKKYPQESVILITNTNNCEILKTMFKENWGWDASPMLADKIVKQCLSNND